MHQHTAFLYLINLALKTFSFPYIFCDYEYITQGFLEHLHQKY